MDIKLILHLIYWGSLHYYTLHNNSLEINDRLYIVREEIILDIYLIIELSKRICRSNVWKDKIKQTIINVQEKFSYGIYRKPIFTS